MFRKRDTHIHFVGIGGIGMSGIAEVLLNMGYAVTGTDLAQSETTRRLAGLGALIHQGHDRSHLGNSDVVVISSAVKADNPEVLAAHERRIPVIPRAEMLAELMRLKQCMVIAGSHGKTTTTSLIANALHEAGLDPTLIIGGKVNNFDSNARLGYGDVLVAEADESDGSFLLLTPTIAVITNIDREHMDHYKSQEYLLDAFVGFANRVPFYGMAILCIEDANVRKILPRINKRTITYGFNSDADYIATDIRYDETLTRFRVLAKGNDQGEFTLNMPGRHNVLNALATIALCDEQQVHVEATRQALATFSGVQRRFSLRGKFADGYVIDDYGHHPTEIRATLSGAREAFPHHRIIAIMQPHRYSRLSEHMNEFAEALEHADLLVLTDVYAAGEASLPNIDSSTLAERVRSRGPNRTVQLIPDIDQIVRELVPLVSKKDLLITLGAGNISKISFDLANALQKKFGVPKHE